MRTIKLSPGGLSKMLEKQAKGLEAAAKRGALAAAQRGAAILAKRGPKDMGELARSWKAKPTSNGAILYSDAPHVGIIEDGAKPHPVSWMGRARLAGWAKRRFKVDDEEAIRIGHAIAAKIEKEGQAATHFIRDAIPKLGDVFAEEVEAEIKALMGKAP